MYKEIKVSKKTCWQLRKQMIYLQSTSTKKYMIFENWTEKIYKDQQFFWIM